MRTIEYVCKKPFKGKALIEVPKYTQRLKYIKECHFKVNESGEVESGANQVDSVIKMIELAKKHVREVEISCGDIKVSSFDEMEDYPEFDSLISEIASVVINGNRVGNA